MGTASQIVTYNGEAVHNRKQTHLTPSSADRILSELIWGVERQSRVHGTARRRVADGGQLRVGRSCSLTKCRVAVPAPAGYLIFEHARAPGALERTDLGGGVVAASDFRTRA